MREKWCRYRSAALGFPILMGFAVSSCRSTKSLSQTESAVATQRTPEAERGYSFLVNGNYIGCGIPVDVMKRAIAAKTIVPDAVMQAFFPIAASEVFVPAEVPGRNADNANIQASFNVFDTPRGVKAMNFNCLSCHGDRINDQYVVGLGNRSRDYSQNLSTFVNFLPLFARTTEERNEIKIFKDSMNAISPYIQTKTIGVNPAINLTYALFARRSAEDFLWRDSLTLEPPARDFPPVDVPPWWRLGKRKSMFYNGEYLENHHLVMSLAATLCIADGKSYLANESEFYDVEKFIKTLKPPLYPLPVNQALAAEGKTSYLDHCASCHGTYGEAGTYTEKMTPIESIGTDPELMNQQAGPEHARFRDWNEVAFRNLNGTQMVTTKNLGYLAPPLDGIWATAPFLHNGSVPTLEGVLNSKLRPTYWQKVQLGKGQDYDIENMAVKYKQVSSGQAQALPLTKRYIYDSSLKGYGNQGHTYSDKLPDEDRKAIFEYLKTL